MCDSSCTFGGLDVKQHSMSFNFVVSFLAQTRRKLLKFGIVNKGQHKYFLDLCVQPECSMWPLK